MNRTLFSIALITTLVSGCASDECAFTEGCTSGESGSLATLKGFEIFYDEPNPIVIDKDGGGHGGVEVAVSIKTSDRQNKLVSGQKVYIRAEWGTLDALSCTTINGSCTVTWTSDQNFGFIPFDDVVVFTAWTIGEESFTDHNGNGFFDQGDTFDLVNNDLPGPYLDLDHSGDFSALDEVLTPGNVDGILTPADGQYNGANCDLNHSLCSSQSSTYISVNSYIYVREIVTVTP